MNNKLSYEEENRKMYAALNEEYTINEKAQTIKDKKEFDYTPSNLRAHFLFRAAPLIDNYIDAALGNEVIQSTNAHAQTEVWGILKTLMLEAKNPAPMLNIKGGTIEEQVKEILTKVSEGKLTLDDGMDYLSLVQQGFELTDLPNLIKKMEVLEAIGFD